MRNFLLGVLLLPVFAHAEPVTVEKPVICDKAETVITGLINGDYKEKPIWTGTDEKSRWSIFANDRTKTWTLIQFNDRIACIIGTGEASKLVFTGPKV